MKNVIFFVVLGVVLITPLGCSSNQKAYEEALAEGLAFIEEDKYEDGKISFQTALEWKPDDEQATVLFIQTELIQQVFEEYESGEFETTVSMIEKILEIENGSDHIVMRAIELQEKIDDLSMKLDEYVKLAEKAESMIENEEIDEAIEMLEHALEKDFNHAVFIEVKNKLKELLDEAQSMQEKIEKEELERQAVEEEKPTEEVGEKSENTSAQQKVDFTGYWLSEDFACHMTSSYIACAMPYSDFITYDQIINIDYLSKTEVEVTTEDGAKLIFKLSDNNSTLHVPDGTYKRVSKEEANAIFDGYYELP